MGRYIYENQSNFCVFLCLCEVICHEHLAFEEFVRKLNAFVIAGGPLPRTRRIRLFR